MNHSIQVAGICYGCVDPKVTFFWIFSSCLVLAVTKVSADAVDPLDAFMQQVKSGKALDTTTRSKLKRRLLEARKEHMRVVKLADLARPSSLPPLQR